MDNMKSTRRHSTFSCESKCTDISLTLNFFILFLGEYCFEDEITCHATKEKK